MVYSAKKYNYDLNEKTKIFWLPKCKNWVTEDHWALLEHKPA